MEVTQKVYIARSPDQVWTFMSDVAAVANCVPGLELIEKRDDGVYVASFSLKVGPLSAKLNGEGTMTLKEETRSATIEGKGVDRRGGSRAKGAMHYQVSADDGGAVIDVKADFTLSGPLAQVGRTGIVNDISQSLTQQFGENLERKLSKLYGGNADEPADDNEKTNDRFDAGQAISSSIKRRVVSGLKRPFGSK